jgi:methionyl-tRNA formyltransferase
LSTVFLGTSEFAAAVLGRLASSVAHRPALVLTRPDRPRGRGQRLASPPVAASARALGIPVAQPASVNDERARALIAEVGQGAAGCAGEPPPPTVVVCSFGALIKEPLLSEHPMLNVHPSLLPRWRGAAPIERAIEAGDSETGVAIMRPTAGLDSGPVGLIATEPIRPTDTYGSLAARLQALGADLLMRALEEAPPFVDQPQEGVTYAEKITAEDRLLDPSRPAVELERVVRALHSHIGARVALADGTLLGVRRAALAGTGSPGDARPAAARGSAEASGEPGALGVKADDGHLLLICAEGALELVEVQPPGGRPMAAAAFLRGHRLAGAR